MKAYAFEAIGPELELMPFSARRAADAAGLKPSLAAWQSLSIAARARVCSAGAEPIVNREQAAEVLSAARPAPPEIVPPPEPKRDLPPEALLSALGDGTPLGPATWSALTPLDRYALMKSVEAADPERLKKAYAEIVGVSAEAPHLDAEGAARMVGVSEKPATLRRAVATSRVSMNAEAFARLERADAPKGDVLGTARIAGIQGAKRTSELIPLCHPLSLTRVDVTLSLDRGAHAVDIQARVEAFDRTGVEMEALTAASTAALTVYDMLKAFDRGMQIGPTSLAEKSGGRSDFRQQAAAVSRFRVSREPLSVVDAVKLVSRDTAGAVVVFLGTVRDHNAGRPVTLLEYQAYESMAGKELERIAAEIEAEIPGLQLSAVHRTGALSVGDAAVVCAASAPHRDEAFRGARLLIDRVKERLPVWKREHAPEGPYWVGWEDARLLSTPNAEDASSR